MALRNFSNSAVETQLAVSVTDSITVMQLTSVTGWPAAPFTIVVDADEITEEVCLVTGWSGTTATVTRGFNGTSAVAHTAGAKVKHAAVAIDFSEANTHVNAVDSVHGVLGDVVGTTDSQTLTNKTIDFNLNTILNPVAGPTGPTGPAGPAGADGLGVPAGGTTGQVLAKASNTDNDTEWVDGGGGATGGGTDQVFYENDQTVTVDYTITSGKNAVTAGPVTVNSGVTVTVPSGSSWVVV